MKTELFLQQNRSLRALNSFGIDATALAFMRIDTLAQLRQVFNEIQHNPQLAALPRLILGGGSNLVLSDKLDCLVLQMNLLGKEVLEHTQDRVLVRAGAGENWHQFVTWTLQQGLGGLENLSLIPGTVGASPIQNIGAYGVEVQDCFESLRAFDFRSGEVKTFNKQECAFAYRDSFFKSDEGKHFVILDVCFSLLKANSGWQANLNYGDVAKRLADKGITSPTPKELSEVIIAIRQSKLPDPELIGNAGSFFKNPIVSPEKRHEVLQAYPHCVNYAHTEGNYKLAAGWLIEQSGWKGRKLGTVGVYDKQALVLVNLGAATGAAVRELALAIQTDVLDKFGVMLEVEPIFV